MVFLSGFLFNRWPLPLHLDAVRKVFIHLAQTSFAGLPNLIKTAKVGTVIFQTLIEAFGYFSPYFIGIIFFFISLQAKVETIKQRLEKDAEKLLRTQFKMELLVYTQDRTYSSSLDESKKEDEENNCFQTKKAKQPLLEFIFKKDNNATLTELMLHLKSYYRVGFDHSNIQNIIFLSSYKISCHSSDCKSTPVRSDPSRDPLSHAARICYPAAEGDASAAAGQGEYRAPSEGGFRCWNQEGGFAESP